MNQSSSILSLKTIDIDKIDDFLNLYFPSEKKYVLELIRDNKDETAEAYGILVDGDLKGVISWKLLKWDTQFFKRRMARIPLILVDTKNTPLNLATELISFVIDKCKENRIVHLDVQVDAGNLFYHRALQKTGFIIVDIKAGFWLNLKENLSNSKNNENDYNIRFIRDNDLSELKNICVGSFRLSRFYSDPFFTIDEADNLHQVWVENLKSEPNNVIFVAEHKSEIVGFVTCRLMDEYGIIDLIATKTEFRSKGVGTLLLLKIIEYSKGRIGKLKVTTQIYNYGAVNLYAKLSFDLEKTEISYSRII